MNAKLQFHVVYFTFDSNSNPMNSSNKIISLFQPSSAASKPRVLTSTTKKPTTTQDIVIFEKDKPVSLDFPGELFGSSFNLVTNLSETVGDFMIVSGLITISLTC